MLPHYLVMRTPVIDRWAVKRNKSGDIAMLTQAECDCLFQHRNICIISVPLILLRTFRPNDRWKVVVQEAFNCK